MLREGVLGVFVRYFSFLFFPLLRSYYINHGNVLDYFPVSHTRPHCKLSAHVTMYVLCERFFLHYFLQFILVGIFGVFRLAVGRTPHQIFLAFCRTSFLLLSPASLCVENYVSCTNRQCALIPAKADTALAYTQQITAAVRLTSNAYSTPLLRRIRIFGNQIRKFYRNFVPARWLPVMIVFLCVRSQLQWRQFFHLFH